MVKLEFGNVHFGGGGKPEHPDKDTCSVARTCNKLNLHDTSRNRATPVGGKGSHQISIIGKATMVHSNTSTFWGYW